MTLLDHCKNVFVEHHWDAWPLTWVRYASGLEIGAALTRAVRDKPESRSLFGSTDLWPIDAGRGAYRMSLPCSRRSGPRC
jgi:hypothetical protein